MKYKEIIKGIQKVLRYYTNFDFISRRKKALKLLKQLLFIHTTMKMPTWKDIGAEISSLYYGVYYAWNLSQVKKILTRRINQIFVDENILNIVIFDLKTNWFVWRNIFEAAEKITDPDKRSVATSRLTIIERISQIFDLSK